MYLDTISPRRVRVVGRIMDGPYEVRTAVPSRAYSDPSQTLKDAGLTPNATIMLRAL